MRKIRQNGSMSSSTTRALTLALFTVISRRRNAKENIMLQAAVETKKTQVAKVTKTKSAEPPKLTEVEKADACNRMSGSDAVCTNTEGVADASKTTEGSNRMQRTKTVKKAARVIV